MLLQSFRDTAYATLFCTRGLNNSSINLEKSRQTGAIMPSGKISEFNDDSASFAPLKLNLFNSCSAGTKGAKILTKISVNFG